MVRKSLLAMVTYLFTLLLLLGNFSPAHSETKKIILFPPVLYSQRPMPYLLQGIKTMLVSRLSRQDVQVITSDKVAGLSETEKKGMIDRKRAEEVARAEQAQYAVFGSVTILGKGYSLDLSLLDLTKNPAKLTHVSEAMSEDEFIPRLGKVVKQFYNLIENRYPPPKSLSYLGEAGKPAAPSKQLFASLNPRESEEPTEGIFRSTRSIPSVQPSGILSATKLFLSIDLDDVDGDHNPEMAVVTPRELIIYKKLGNRLKQVDKAKISMGKRFLKVSLGDMNGNGKAEIYAVWYQDRGRVYTTVYEWQGKLQKLFKRPGHFRVVKGSLRPYLIYQDSKPLDLFYGNIFRMRYSADGRLVRLTKLPALKYSRFYTILLIDLGKDKNPEYIGLGQHNKLSIWDGTGKLLWRDDKSIGGTNNAVDLVEFSTEKDLPRVPFDSRLCLVDIDGDGVKEVIAAKNIPIVARLEHFRFYDKSRLLGYRFRGATLHREWETSKFPYCIVDIQQYNKALYIAFQKPKIKNFGKARSRIMWFNLAKSK